MREELLALDSIRLNFSTEGVLFINLTLAFIMFGVALDIKIHHFRDVFKSPKLPIIGFLSQFMVLPIVTFLIIILFNKFITPTVAMGMILVAACPGGNISNFITALAKGNAALSVSLTAIATIAAIVMTPLNFKIWGGLYNGYLSASSHGLLQPLSINPNRMFQAVIILLGIPLVLGMLTNHFLPKITARIEKPIRIGSIVIFFLLVIAMLSNNIEYFLAYIKFVFIIVLIHNGIGYIAGSYFSRLFGIHGANRRTIAIETGIQNSGLGLALLFNPKIFPVELNNGGMAFIAAWWGIWHIISGLTLAWYWSGKPSKIN